MTKQQQHLKSYARLTTRGKVRKYLQALHAFNKLHEKDFALINEAFNVDCKEICMAYGITYNNK